MFEYLRDKDVFQAYYKHHLSKRLLHFGKSSVFFEEAERSFIGKMKRRCGYGFTSNLEGMLNDVSISQKLNSKYQEQHQEDSLYVNVITSCHWPTYHRHTVQLKSEMKSMCERFATFYETLHSGRKLIWNYHLGEGVLMAYFDYSKHELYVTTSQMILLLLFNVKTQYSVAELCSETGYNERVVESNMKQLVKKKLLIDRSDNFVLNTKFSSPRMKVKIAMLRMSTRTTTNKITSKVVLERKPLIESAIVRYVLTTLSFCHSDLDSHVVFSVNVQG